MKKIIGLVLLILMIIGAFLLFNQFREKSYEEVREERLKIVNNPKVFDLYHFKDFPLQYEVIQYHIPSITYLNNENQTKIQIGDSWFFNDADNMSQFVLKAEFMEDSNIQWDKHGMYDYVDENTLKEITVKGVEGIYSMITNYKGYENNLPRYQEVIYFVLEGVQYSVFTSYVNDKPFGSDYLVEVINNHLIKKD